MEIRVLNKKITIQIVSLVFSFAILAMGLTGAAMCESYLELRLNGNPQYGWITDMSALFFGVAICLWAIMQMTISALHISNYVLMKNNIKIKAVFQHNNSADESSTINFLAPIKEQLTYLQTMQNDGLISAEEAEKMRTAILAKGELV